MKTFFPKPIWYIYKIYLTILIKKILSFQCRLQLYCNMSLQFITIKRIYYNGVNTEISCKLSMRQEYFDLMYSLLKQDISQ